jgi:hypothetical protein
VTTGKDAVKLRALTHTPIPFYRMDTRVEVLETEAFEALIGSVLARGS